MATISIRKSGSENIISIPKAIVKTLGLHVGSKLDLSIENNKIILTPIKETRLEDLLAGSPRECFQLNEEDKEWINAKPIGKEI